MMRDEEIKAVENILKLNPLVDINVSLYFKIYNAEMYGGKDTVGYAMIHCGRIKSIADVTSQNAEMLTQAMADMLKVSRSEIVLISKEEYEYETGEGEAR